MAQTKLKVEQFAFITRGAYAGQRARIDVDHGSSAWLTVNENTINLPEEYFVRECGGITSLGIPEWDMTDRSKYVWLGLDRGVTP